MSHHWYLILDQRWWKSCLSCDYSTLVHIGFSRFGDLSFFWCPKNVTPNTMRLLGVTMRSDDNNALQVHHVTILEGLFYAVLRVVPWGVDWSRKLCTSEWSHSLWEEGAKKQTPLSSMQLQLWHLQADLALEEKEFTLTFSDHMTFLFIKFLNYLLPSLRFKHFLSFNFLFSTNIFK